MKGSCLCGAIEYTIEGLDMPISHCHCGSCAGVKREHFRWIKGQERLSTFESSPGKLRHFCSVCGSQLIAERPQQAHVIVRIATLDEDPGVRPQQHIWTSHDVPWLEYEGVAAYPEWQPGR